MTKNQTTVDNWVDQAEAVETGKAESGSLVVKLTGENSVTSPGADPSGPSYERQHAKVVRFEISVGKDDDERSIEDFTAAIREALTGGAVNAHNVTYQGGYYLIDGKVCLEQDYDPATKNRKPGTFPPFWAGGPDPKKPAPLYVVEDDGPREFVRVKPTIKPRDPLTGRRARKDKGVKRGPRKPVSVEARDAIAKMGAELKAEVQSE